MHIISRRRVPAAIAALTVSLTVTLGIGSPDRARAESTEHVDTVAEAEATAAPDPLERNDNDESGSFGAFAKFPGTDAASRRANPLVTQNFGADPWAMEYDGRVYVYTTNDTQEWVDHLENGESNNYGRINQINVWSSADMMNWTNHGPINAAGDEGITRNAQGRPGNSWAPAAAVALTAAAWIWTIIRQRGSLPAA
jgi:hypothetical protein